MPSGYDNLHDNFNQVNQKRSVHRVNDDSIDNDENWSNEYVFPSNTK